NVNVMRSSVTSMRCACATAREYRVFFTDLISARRTSFKAELGATTSLAGATVSGVGARLLLVGAMVLPVGAMVFLVGAGALRARAGSLTFAGAGGALARAGADALRAGAGAFLAGADVRAGPAPPSSRSTSGTSLSKCIQRR